MKKSLLIIFLLSFHYASAKTGTQEDSIFLLLSVCVFLLFIITVLYSIEFFRKICKQRKEKKITETSDNSENENMH
jgi:Kef-type K+ transport system membrane component KefB